MTHRAHPALPRVSAVGARSEDAPATCRKGNNPFFHPRDCDCITEVRASQQVPYEEPTYPPSWHAALFEGD